MVPGTAGLDVVGRHFWSTITTINIQATLRVFNRNASIKGKKGGEGMVERGLGFCFLPTAEGARGRAGLSI